MSNSASENTPSFEVTELLQRVETFGIRLSPPARLFVLDELSKAMELGTIETAEHEAQGAAALIAAGAQAAGWSAPTEGGSRVAAVWERAQSRKAELEEPGSVPVTVVLEPSHLREGWMTLAGGHHPPYRCFRRTVLERVADVEETLPLFRVPRGGPS